MPLTSRAASSDAYRFASTTASLIATSGGTLSSSSSWIPILRMFRSSVPMRSAVQPSADAVIRSSSSVARADHRLGELRRELVRHAGVERGQRLAGQIPLVEEEERGAARLPAALCRSCLLQLDDRDVDGGDGQAGGRAPARRRRFAARPRRAPAAPSVARRELELDAGAPVLDLRARRRASAGGRERRPRARRPRRRGRRGRSPRSGSLLQHRRSCGPSCSHWSSLTGPRAPAGAPPSPRGSSSSSRRSRTRASGGCRARGRASSARPRARARRAHARPARSPPAGLSAQTTSFAISES